MSVAASPPVLSVLAHDLRWTIMRLLVPGDLRTSELVRHTGEAPNLVSYHLGRLRDAGLVSARRSTADGRDTYYAADLDALRQAVAGAAGQLHPGLLSVAARPPAGPGQPPGRVTALFICSGNSARSPMAAAWLNHLGGGSVTATSAGVTPGAVHPLAVAAMAEHGIDISGHRATPVSSCAGSAFARVITLCDRAREDCAGLPPATAAVHWSIPNPAQAHPPDLDAFRGTARELCTRICYLLPLLADRGQAPRGAG